MGLIGAVVGRALGAPGATEALGRAAGGVAEVFVPNATRRMETAHEAYVAALESFGAEFQSAGPGRFDRFVNGLNRLPRPCLAFGTIGLFSYAMIDPPGFAARMQGLAHVPEPLWWLLAAIVGFYFGAREAHYLRAGRLPRPPVQGDGDAVPQEGATPVQTPRASSASAKAPARTGRPPARGPAKAANPRDGNPALDEWRELLGRKTDRSAPRG
jgi:hypothetical protein